MTKTKFENTRAYYDDKAEKAAGNWKHFENFIWFERPPDAENWTIVYTHHRDSGLTDRANGIAIAKALEPFHRDPRKTTVRPETHSNWACGHMHGFAIKVYGRYGKTPTKAFKIYCDLMSRLDHYALLDESIHSELEYEAACEGIKTAGYRWVQDKPPANWAEQVYDWLANNDDKELESVDDQGACPSEEAVKKALIALGLNEPEEEGDEEQEAAGGKAAGEPYPEDEEDDA